MVGLSGIRRGGLMAVAGFATLILAACSGYEGKIPKHLAPLEKATLALLEKKGMEQRAPIIVRIFKEESTLEVWKKEKGSNSYALLKSYPICKWSGVLGPKLREGDRQAPEGFYSVRPAQMNPNSQLYLSFNIGYPNDFDRSLGRTGTYLMVHGACSSAGCYSMTDEQIQEIYTLGRLAFEGGQRDFQVQAFPFRMTPENLARHRNDPNIAFWRMLKEGYDHFEVTRQPPKVDVCEKRYIFNSVPNQAGVEFDPSGACPPTSTPDYIAMAVAEKQAKDDRQFLQIAARLDRSGPPAGSATTTAAAPSASPAPMSVAAAPLPLEPATTASIAAPPAEPSLQAAPAQAAGGAAVEPPPAVATAYAPAAPKRGLFGRILDKVNPF